MSTKFASNPSCDGKKFFIEVTGIQHGSEHDFEFYDLADMSQQVVLDAKKSIDPELDDSTVYSWDWCDESDNRNVWLKIEAEGEPIKLPLFHDVTAISRKQNEQDYLVHAVLPFTLLPTYQSSLTYRDRIAPVRAGFIYIFYNHKAWREIQISPEESGEYSLKDVHLYHYRTGRDEPFKEEARMATGAALKEIWVPAKEKNNNAHVHIAFSEVQWSAQYLNYLEANQNELVQRAVALHQLNVEGNTDVLKASLLPTMRARSPELELFLAEPSSLNRDLSGQWVARTYQTIKEEMLSADDGDNAVQVFKYTQPYRYEYAMKQAALVEIINADPAQAESWTIGGSSDVLEDAKQRHLRAIVVDDPLFDLRHHAFLTQSAVGYLQQVYVDMSQQKYYRSAELVQKLVLPAKFGQQDNPYYQYRNAMDNYYGGVFHRTLRTTERQCCCTDVKWLQGQLQSLVNQQRLADVLRDISSMNDINASAAHVIVGYALSALSVNIDKLDQMSNPESDVHSPYLDTARQILSPTDNHPLHRLLFPEDGAISLEEASYSAPEPSNSGSGFATLESLALWSKEDMLIQDEQLQVMDLAFMSPANSNQEKAFNLERRVANIMDEILRGYFDTLLNLSQDLANEAKVIQFNAAYAPVLGLMKATNAKMWGDITYVPVSGAELKGTVIGVHGHGLSYGLSAADREFVDSKKKSAFGRLYDRSGKLVASTNKNAFSSSDLISESRGSVGAKSPLKVVVVSQESRMAAALNQANTQRALRDMNRTDLNVSNAYEKFRIPYFIAVVELINLKQNQQHLINVFAAGKDFSYSVANALSAALDLGIAITHASNLYTRNASRLATASHKTAVVMPDFLVKKMTFDNGKVRLVSSISRLGVISIGAGFLTAGIAGWDAMRHWQNNDRDASVALGMVAIGTLTTTVATGFFTTSAPVLFGMGPVAWLGIGLAVAGFALYMFWKDTPMEAWLKNGPFGQSPSSTYAHLQNPTTAFERFIGLIFTLSVNAYRLGPQTEFPEAFTEQMQRLGATHVIYVNTNLAALINAQSVRVEFYARQAIEKKTTTSSRTGSRESSELINLSSHNVTVIHQEQRNEGTAYFVKYDLTVPEYSTDFSWLMMRSYEYRYQPVFVLRTKLHVEQASFPTLALEERDDSRIVNVVPTFALDNNSDQDWTQNTVLA